MERPPTPQPRITAILHDSICSPCHGKPPRSAAGSNPNQDALCHHPRRNLWTYCHKSIGPHPASAPSKPCFRIRKFLPLTLLCLFSLAPLPILSAGETNGVLSSFPNEEGGSYFGIAVDQPLVWKSPDGQVVKSKFPQLAGPDQLANVEAELWTGRRVRITGQPMERHTRHHATPMLWLADKVILEDYDGPKVAGDGFVTERINLFGVPAELVIQKQIPEYGKTWAQVRDITLARLNAEPQDKPSLRAALKRINDIQIAIVRKNEKAWANLAAKTGQSLEQVAFIFQSGEGSEKYPELQNDTDVVNGIYQIESALAAKVDKK